MVNTIDPNNDICVCNDGYYEEPSSIDLINFKNAGISALPVILGDVSPEI